MIPAMITLRIIAVAALATTAARAIEYSAWKQRSHGAETVDTGVVNVKEYGAIGDGTAVDTASIQRALDSLTPGQTLLIPPGTYLASELLVPEVADITIAGTGGGGGMGGGTGGGTNHSSVLRLAPHSGGRFVLATVGYARNFTWTGPPLSIVDLAFAGPGANATTDTGPAGAVLMAWSSRIARCRFTGFGRAGLLVAAANMAGATIATTQVNSRYESNVFDNNAGDGFRILDPARNKNTDYFLINSFAFGNDGAGFHLDTTAGALISGNHLYGQKAGSFDVEINIGSMALRFVDNYLEGALGLRISTMNAGVGVIATGNCFEGVADVTANDGNATLMSAGNSFGRPCAGGGCMRLAGNRGHTLVVTSVGDRFAGAGPSFSASGSVEVLTAPLAPAPAGMVDRSVGLRERQD